MIRRSHSLADGDDRKEETWSREGTSDTHFRSSRAARVDMIQQQYLGNPRKPRGLWLLWDTSAGSVFFLPWQRNTSILVEPCVTLSAMIAAQEALGMIRAKCRSSKTRLVYPTQINRGKNFSLCLSLFNIDRARNFSARLSIIDLIVRSTIRRQSLF